jgi:hypothetical protein
MIAAMSPIRRSFAGLLLAAAIAAPGSLQAGYQRINKSNPADPMAVEIYRLDNGLTVYLSENHETPRFEAQIAVRAGSKNDPADATGLAHYLEHLLFKGTTRLGTTDYAKEKPHLDRITALYEQHFRETDPEKRRQIYAEINRESLARGNRLSGQPARQPPRTVGHHRVRTLSESGLPPLPARTRDRLRGEEPLARQQGFHPQRRRQPAALQESSLRPANHHRRSRAPEEPVPRTRRQLLPEVLRAG